jgi:LDH2 family malate/lactate/ureidoglycolate dehydrogenase
MSGWFGTELMKFGGRKWYGMALWIALLSGVLFGLGLATHGFYRTSMQSRYFCVIL